LYTGRKNLYTTIKYYIGGENMLQNLKFIAVVIKFLPTIISVVRKVERLYNENDGTEKKKIAMSILEELLSKQFPKEKTDSLLQVVDKGIDFVVAVLNAYNLWR
jgi:hypothetical protein